jgi:hypothetical protein
MRGVKDLAKSRKRPAELTAIFKAGQELSAHCDIAGWNREKMLDRIGIIKHGKGWGSPAANLASLQNQYRHKYQLPTSMIFYSLNGSKAEIQTCLDKAVTGKVKNIIWFETTYLYFKDIYALPTAAACPEKLTLKSPVYDLTKGGKIYVVAAGSWTLKIAGETIAAGKADTPAMVKVPALVTGNSLEFTCSLPKDSTKAGIAVQGRIGSTAIQTDASWKSSQGEVVTLAQPGVPPFLAPLDEAVTGGVK